MEEKKELKKGDNPKGQGPCKPKKIKTKEENKMKLKLSNPLIQ